MKNLSEKKQIEFDIIYKSLIGKSIEIVDSRNKLNIGLKGTIIYESANLFHVQVNDEIKKVLKSNITIKFDYKGKSVEVNCSLLKNILTQRLKKMK